MMKEQSETSVEAFDLLTSSTQFESTDESVDEGRRRLTKQEVSNCLLKYCDGASLSFDDEQQKWDQGSKEWCQLIEVLTYALCPDEEEINQETLTKILSSRGVLEKLFQLINKKEEDQVTRQEIMDFIANLTYARPRTGFTKENLEWLEKLFRQALGHKEELSYDDFKKIVNSKNSFFAERVFQIFDRDKSGTVSLSEFLDAMHQFAGKSPEDKFEFLFRVYDLDGDGLIQQSELQQVLQACMEENGMTFSKEQIEDLTLAMFEDADSDQKGEITYESLKAQLEKHNGLIENLSISIDRWLVPPPPAENKSSIWVKMQKLRPYQLTLPYIKNNYVYLSFLVLYFCINLSLFISRAVEYSGNNGFTIVARACGQCLNFNCMFTLVLMLRQCLTFLRAHGAGSFLPLDYHLYLHKMVGWVIFILSLIHALMHLCNFGAILQYSTGPGEINENGCSLVAILFTDCIQDLGLVDGWANPTGVLLLLILTLMVICSQPFVRKSGYFEVFYWTHLLYIVFFIVTILHSSNFWKWFIAPGIVFLIEKTHKTIQTRTGRGKTYISSGVLLPSKVINLVIQRPPQFHFHPGDYVFVNIPAIAKYEWHPFTISSAPEQDVALWLHVRAVGEWTNRLHRYFELHQQKCEKIIEANAAQQIPLQVTETSKPADPPHITIDIKTLDSITEEAPSPISTPQRKKAIINMGFEGDETDAQSKNMEKFLSQLNKDKSVTSNSSAAITPVAANAAPPVTPKKPGPQKVQSTPNFFVKKEIPRKKILEKSLSVPNIMKKKSKEEKANMPPLLRTRTISDAQFDRTALRQAQTIAMQEALQRAHFLNSADRSVAQTYRYMRVKPTVITLDMPTLDEPDSQLEISASHSNRDLRVTSDGESEESEKQKKMRKKSKNVTIASVESAVNNISDKTYTEATTKLTSVEDDSQNALRKRKKSRRISRLEEAESLGHCVGKPLEIYIDGPYGAPSSHIFRAQHAVLIGTGIGVTPFASILQSIMHKYWKARHTCPKCDHAFSSDIPQSVMNLRKVDFFWINRDQRSFEWFVNLLSQLEIEQAEQGGVMERFLDMHMYITSALQKTDMKAVGLQLAFDLLHEKGKRDLITGLKTRTNAGRPNWDKVFKELKKEDKGRITVFYCGPPALGRTLRYKCDEYGFNFKKEIF